MVKAKWNTYVVSFEERKSERTSAATAIVQHGVLILLDDNANMIKAYKEWAQVDKQ